MRVSSPARGCAGPVIECSGDDVLQLEQRVVGDLLVVQLDVDHVDGRLVLARGLDADVVDDGRLSHAERAHAT